MLRELGLEPGQLLERHVAQLGVVQRLLVLGDLALDLEVALVGLRPAACSSPRSRESFTKRVESLTTSGWQSRSSSSS